MKTLSKYAAFNKKFIDISILIIPSLKYGTWINILLASMGQMHFFIQIVGLEPELPITPCIYQ